MLAAITGIVCLLTSAHCVHGAGGSQVFDLGNDLDPFLYALMMTVVLVGLIVFDSLVEGLEHYLHHHKARFHRRLFKKTVKELMILGGISFVMFILKDQSAVDTDDDTFINTFDFVNLFLFFVGVSLVFAAVFLVLFTSPIKARWDTYANVGLEELLALHRNIISTPWTYYVLWIPRYYRMLRQAQVIEYHLFRSVFLRLNRSLLTPAFDFSKYSATTIDELIIDNFDVGWMSWLLAIIILFFTLPISDDQESGAEVSAIGAFFFGVAVLLMEIVTVIYAHLAHQRVCRRMGVKGGFTGVAVVLEKLWVAPQHHLGNETSALDVKDLLAAAPGKAPTRNELTSELDGSKKGVLAMHVNFRGKQAPSSSSMESSVDGSKRSMNDVSSYGKTPCTVNGLNCKGCESCDPLWLPPGAVIGCDMGGDPFIFKRLYAPQWLAKCMPKLFKGASLKVGCHGLFSTLFGMCMLQKCYYCAFFFAYAIGEATLSNTREAVMWVILTPIPLLLCLLPLAKRTLPCHAQLGCLQGQIVWELVSQIEDEQEIAERARSKVLTKLQAALQAKMDECRAAAEAGTHQTTPTPASPRTKALDNWFNEWDRNRDGVITRSELDKGLQNVGVFLSVMELRELFRLADPDHSKTIDLVEFRSLLSDLKSLETEPERLRREIRLRDLQAARNSEKRRRSKIMEGDLLVGLRGAGGINRNAATTPSSKGPTKSFSLSKLRSGEKVRIPVQNESSASGDVAEEAHAASGQSANATSRRRSTISDAVHRTPLDLYASNGNETERKSEEV